MHIAQLMPLPLTVSCFRKMQIGFTFPVPAHLGSPGKRVIKRVCVHSGKNEKCKIHATPKNAVTAEVQALLDTENLLQ